MLEWRRQSSRPRRIEPSRSATRAEGVLAASMQLMMSFQPSAVTAQSIAAAAPSVP
jgi:hypothetical protein